MNKAKIKEILDKHEGELCTTQYENYLGQRCLVGWLIVDLIGELPQGFKIKSTADPMYFSSHREEYPEEYQSLLKVAEYLQTNIEGLSDIQVVYDKGELQV